MTQTRPQPQEQPKGQPEWLTTYSDLITLLFCFFVMLFAMSDVDQGKFDAMARSFAAGGEAVLSLGKGDGITDLLGSGITEIPDPGRETPEVTAERVELIQQTQNRFDAMAEAWRTYFLENYENQGVAVDVLAQEIKMTFPDGLLFDSGEAALKPAALPALAQIAEEMKQFEDVTMRIEGHTDNRPINTARYPSNWQLSADRAFSVMSYYITAQGISPTRFMVVPRGDLDPVADNGTEEGRAANRRVVIYIMSEYYSGGEEAAGL